MDGRAAHPLLQLFGDHEIVDAPACVRSAGVSDIAPPAVFAGFIRIEMAEAVDETGAEQLGELAALLVGEAGVFMVGLGVFEVDFLMRDVQIAAENDRLDRVELLELKTEVEWVHNTLGRGRHREYVTNQYAYFAKYGKCKTKQKLEQGEECYVFVALTKEPRIICVYQADEYVITDR